MTTWRYGATYIKDNPVPLDIELPEGAFPAGQPQMQKDGWFVYWWVPIQ